MDDTTKKYHSALSQCAELLPNMLDGDSIFDAPKFLAAHLAGTSQATKAQAEPLGYISVPAFEMLKSKRAVSIVVTPESNTERVALYAAPVAKEAPAVPEAVIAKWISLRGNVVTCAINGTATYFPPEDTNELLNVFDAALPAKSDDEDSEVVALVAKEAEKEQQAAERALDLYDEIECDLPSLFGRASNEGHEACQRLAEEVRAKMQCARAAGQSTLLSEILALAKQGMCHGLLADDYCSQIVAKIKDLAPTTSTVSAPEPVGYVVDSDKGESIVNVALPVGTQVFTREGAPAAPEEVRNQALEEAAQLAQETDVATFTHAQMLHDDGSQTRSDIAAAIRALKRTSTAQANVDTDTGSAE